MFDQLLSNLKLTHLVYHDPPLQNDDLMKDFQIEVSFIFRLQQHVC